MTNTSAQMEANQLQENDNAAPAATENNSSPERVIKHPLEHKWTFWFFENNKSKAWLDNLHEVYTFDTVEDFWCLYNQIRSVEDLTHGNDYMLFKHGIEPKWEDSRNHRGGRWLINVESRHKHKLNDLWLNALLFMIGESFDEYSDQICGAFINIRAKADRISLWTTDATKMEEIVAIGRKLKYDCLNMDPDQKIHYETHTDSQSKSSSRARSILTC